MSESSDSKEQVPNPYASPTTSPSKADPFYQPGELTGFVPRCGWWILVSIVCAAPSFMLGYGLTTYRYRGIAMALAVVVFGIFYGLFDWLYLRHVGSRNRRFHNAMKQGIALRMVASSLVPAGAAVDIWTGMVAVSIVGMFTGDQQLTSWPSISLTVWVQGLLMNAIMWLGIGGIYAIAGAWSSGRD